jgi:hypothetical protein
MNYQEAIKMLKLHLMPPANPWRSRRDEAGGDLFQTDEGFIDLQEILTAYGVGWINEYLKLYSPVAKDKESNLFDKTEEFKKIVFSLPESDGGIGLIRRLLVENRRLCVVWGGSINGETLLLDGERGAVSERVFLVSADMDVVTYWCSAAEFLFNLVCGRIKGEFFSPEFHMPHTFRSGV